MAAQRGESTMDCMHFPALHPKKLNILSAIWPNLAATYKNKNKKYKIWLIWCKLSLYLDHHLGCFLKRVQVFGRLPVSVDYAPGKFSETMLQIRLRAQRTVGRLGNRWLAARLCRWVREEWVSRCGWSKSQLWCKWGSIASVAATPDYQIWIQNKLLCVYG